MGVGESMLSKGKKKEEHLLGNQRLIKTQLWLTVNFEKPHNLSGQGLLERQSTYGNSTASWFKSWLRHFFFFSFTKITLTYQIERYLKYIHRGDLLTPPLLNCDL